MIHLSSPAPIMEALDLATETHGQLKPWQRKATILQLLGSDTVAFRHRIEGRLIAVAGFFPLPPERAGEELAEIWFLCRPDLGRDLLAFVRMARLTVARASQDGTVRIRAFVREGHAPGARLAALCGLVRIEARHGFDEWEWQGGQDGEVHQFAVRGEVDRREERGPGGQ